MGSSKNRHQKKLSRDEKIKMIEIAINIIIAICTIISTVALAGGSYPLTLPAFIISFDKRKVNEKYKKFKNYQEIFVLWLLSM